MDSNIRKKCLQSLHFGIAHLLLLARWRGLQKRPYLIDLGEQTTLNTIMLPVVLKLSRRAWRTKKYSSVVTDKRLISTVYDQEFGLRFSCLVAQLRIA